MITFPVGRDWPADPNLQDQRDEVVDDQKRAQRVDALRLSFVRRKDSRDQRENAELDEEHHENVYDGPNVEGLVATAVSVFARKGWSFVARTILNRSSSS
jgi:hypothetical protein